MFRRLVPLAAALCLALPATAKTAPRPPAASHAAPRPHTAAPACAWKSTLRHVGRHFCADCPGVSCNFTRTTPDPICARYACADASCRPAAAAPCGGSFGLYLHALSVGCKHKSIDYLDGLDGLTYGIRNSWSANMPGLLQEFATANRQLFEETFRGADLASWYRNGQVQSAGLCQLQLRQHGLACHAGLRNALHTAATRQPFIQAMLSDAFNHFRGSCATAVHAGFTSVYARVTWAVMANNPGHCNIGRLAAACRGTQDQKTECLINSYVRNACRDGADGARRRAAAIRDTFHSPALRGATVQDPASLASVLSSCGR